MILHFLFFLSIFVVLPSLSTASIRCYNGTYGLLNDELPSHEYNLVDCVVDYEYNKGVENLIASAALPKNGCTVYASPEEDYYRVRCHCRENLCNTVDCFESFLPETSPTELEARLVGKAHALVELHKKTAVTYTTDSSAVCLLQLLLGANTIEETEAKVSSLIRRVNADNNFVSAKLLKVDCADEENDQVEQCKGVGESPTLEIKELERNHVSIHETMNLESDEKIFKQVYKVFAKFVNKLFVSRSNGGKVDGWWSSLPSEFFEKISQHSLSSTTEVEEFKSLHVKEHSLVVCYKSEGFENFAAVFSAIRAAEETKAPVGLLSCQDSVDLCCQETERLPHIVDIYKGEVYQEFTDILDPEKVADFVKIIRAPYLFKLNEDLVPHFRSGIIPEFSLRRETTIMLFSPNKTNEPYRLYDQFAKANHGKYHIGALVDSGVYRWPHHPAIIMGKPLERVTQANVHYEDMSEEGIARFIEEGSRPSMHYIFDGKSTDSVFSIGRPILFFFDKKRNTDASVFAQLAANEKIRFESSSFAVLNGRNLFTVYLAEMLNLQDRNPSYVLYLPEKKCAHIEPVEQQSLSALESWLNEKLEEDCDEHPVKIDAANFAGNRLWERKRELSKQLNAAPTPSFHDEL